MQYPECGTCGCEIKRWQLPQCDDCKRKREIQRKTKAEDAAALTDTASMAEKV